MPEIRETNDIVTQITTVKVPPDNQAEVLHLMAERARFMSLQSAVQHLASAAGAFLAAHMLSERADHSLVGMERGSFPRERRRTVPSRARCGT